MRHVGSEALARRAAEVLAERLQITDGNRPKLGVVLGTGWGGALPWGEDARRVSMKEIPGFDADALHDLPGHDRQVVCGTLNEKRVIALQGRVHLNEHPSGEVIPRMVRLQVEMLFQLGVQTLILTAAAGSLRPEIEVGDIVVIDGLVTLFAPKMPLFTGEFCSPEDTLHPKLREMAVEAIRSVSSRAAEGGHVMVCGPFFEGRKYDKPLLKQSGASVVGMSILPEACVAALYPGVRVVALTFITNSATEEHSHETNQARAKERSQDMGRVLLQMLAQMG